MTKKESLERCRKILYGNVTNHPIPEEDFKFLVTRIFPLHKSWGEKRGGKEIKAVIVRRNDLYGNKQFALVLDDNTIADISFTECINRPGLKKDIRMACLNALSGIDTSGSPVDLVVKSWLEGFEDGELTIGKYLTPDGSGFVDPSVSASFRSYYNERV